MRRCLTWIGSFVGALLFWVTLAQVYAGDIKIDSSTRYLRDAAGKPIFLMGYYEFSSIDPNRGINGLTGSYVDMINVAAQHNLNYIRPNLGINYDPGSDNPIPFKIVGGKADLDQWDPNFWNGLRYHIDLARQKGIFFHVPIFDGVNIRAGGGEWWRWGGSFWKIDNQTGNFFGDIDTNGNGSADENGEFYRLTDFNNNTGIGYYQRRLIDKTIAETAGYDNVFFEVGNELLGSTSSWNQAVIAYIKARTGKAVTQNDWAGATGNTDGFSDHSPNSASEVKQGVASLVGQGYPAWQDPDGSSLCCTTSSSELRRAAWYSFTGGAAGWGGFTYDFSGQTVNTQKPAQYKILMDFIESSGIKFWEMVPSHDLVSNNGVNLCLAKPGTEYLIHLPDGGDFTLDLSGASGTFNVSWFNPRDGDTIAGGTVAGGTSASFTAPDWNDWALRLVKSDTSGNPPPAPGAIMITAPAEGTAFSPGQTVTVQGSGSNLSWSVDRIGDGLPDFASGAGASFTFSVPADANSVQTIEIKLTGAEGSDNQSHGISM